MKTRLNNLFLQPVLIAGLNLILLGRVAAQTFTFGTEIDSTSSANITNNSGTFQYTDSANSGYDFAALPLIGTVASLITTSNNWTASLFVNLAQRTMTATSTEEPSVGMGWLIEINGSVNNIVYVALEQVNDTGVTNYNIYGNGVAFTAEVNGQNVQTTPLDGSQLQNNGTSLLKLLPQLAASGPATETNSAVSGVLTLNFSAASDTLTGSYNGTPVGGISLTNWGSNPALVLAVLGLSGQGIAVATNTDTASNFFAGITLPTLTIINSGTNVVLTWPTNAVGFTLQSATNLDPPAVWTTVSSMPVVVNTNYAVTNAISGTEQFYRLSQ